MNRIIFALLLVACSGPAATDSDASSSDASSPDANDESVDSPDAQADVSVTDAATNDAASDATKSGTQNVLAILVNLSDKSVPVTTSSVSTTLFTAPKGVNAFYEASSHGAVSFTGTVVGPFDISDSSWPCNYAQWDDDALAAAIAHGVSTSGVQHLVFVYASTSCAYTGITNSQLSPTRVNIFGGSDTTVFAHELGHALGMTHASTPTLQYGDYTDVMGDNALYATHNGPHKVQMGWTMHATVPTCSACSYTIENLESTPTQTQVLLVPRKTEGDYYYVSYRVPTGFDTSVANAVSVHYWSGKSSTCGPTSTYSQGACNTYFVTSLSDGKSFTDSANGVVIQQVSHDSTTATVSITTP